VREDLHLELIWRFEQKRIIKKIKAKLENTEGLVNYLYLWKELKVAALFSEREDGIKISFRSMYKM